MSSYPPLYAEFEFHCICPKFDSIFNDDIKQIIEHFIRCGSDRCSSLEKQNADYFKYSINIIDYGKANSKCNHYAIHLSVKWWYPKYGNVKKQFDYLDKYCDSIRNLKNFLNVYLILDIEDDSHQKVLWTLYPELYPYNVDCRHHYKLLFTNVKRSDEKNVKIVLNAIDTIIGLTGDIRTSLYIDGEVKLTINVSGNFVKSEEYIFAINLMSTIMQCHMNCNNKLVKDFTKKYEKSHPYYAIWYKITEAIKQQYPGANKLEDKKIKKEKRESDRVIKYNNIQFKIIRHINKIDGIKINSLIVERQGEDDCEFLKIKFRNNLEIIPNE
jgi:hypothetical protein